MGSPRIVCEAEDVADFGYGPKEYFACTSPATHIIKEVSPWGLEKGLICVRHANRFKGGMFNAKVYRFRRV